MSRSTAQRGPSALELVEEAVQLLRQLPLPCWLAYYGGTVPFLVALLFFWIEMSSGGHAKSSCLPGSILLVPLFLSMKVCQTIFASNLRRQFAGQAPLYWSIRRLWKVARIQGAIQPWRLLVLPIAAVITLPFAWTIAFFENVTVLGQGDSDEFAPDIKRAVAQAKVWPGQNHLLVFILLPITLVTWLNVVLGCVSLPYFLKWFLGIDTLFTRASGSVFLNTTFFAITGCLTYLVIDPLVKALYSLRCFYGEARKDGADLLAEIALIQERRSGLPLAVVFVFLLFTQLPTPADTPDFLSQDSGKSDVSAPQMDKAIEDTLAQKKYQWRMPRATDVKAENSNDSWLDKGLHAVGTASKRAYQAALDAFDWLRRLFMGEEPESSESQSPSSHWRGTLRGFSAGVLILSAAATAYLLWQSGRKIRQKGELLVAKVIPAAPDLQDEAVLASQLPENEWLQLAHGCMEKGDFRLALRAFFLATLAHLAHREMVTLARFKSNRDYLTEIRRRGRHLPVLQASFAENVLTFERSWYGFHEVTVDILNQFKANLERMRSC